MPRKIIQIFDHNGDICALCNDGTTWWWRERTKEWLRAFDDAPQDDAPQDNVPDIAAPDTGDLPIWLRGRLWVLGTNEPIAFPVNDVTTAVACDPDRMAYANDANEAAEIITRWCANDRGGMSMETPRIGDIQISYISELPF